MEIDYFLLSLFIFKMTGLSCGLFTIYLGYKLFTKRIFNSDGEFNAEYKDNKLFFKSIAPGVFFVVLGSIITISVIFSEYTYHKTPNYQGITKPKLP